MIYLFTYCLNITWLILVISCDNIEYIESLTYICIIPRVVSTENTDTYQRELTINPDQSHVRTAQDIRYDPNNQDVELVCDEGIIRVVD